MGSKFSRRKGKLTKEQKSEINRSAKIDSSALKDHMEDSKVIKLLLLGAGESGKSTLFKQMIKLYGEGFDEASMSSYTPAIFKNTIVGMKTLVKFSNELNEAEPTVTGPGLDDAKKIVDEAKEEEMTVEVAEAVTKLWANEGIKKTFHYRARMQIPDSCAYFFEQAPRLAEKDYVPIYEDILRCRARTTGIVETRFNVQGNRFQMMDVGGQRSERKKWIHCFQDVTAVIFVAAINEYDQVLYEDGVTNRIDEALELFNKTCNSKWFDRASMILFLNKRDLFYAKVPEVDMKCCFKDYTGGHNIEAAEEFMKMKFLEQNENPEEMPIYVHVTCATDTDNVNFTFNSVKDILLSNSLKGSGLM